MKQSAMQKKLFHPLQ